MIEKHINVTLYVSGVVTDQAKIASFDPEVHVPDEVTKFVEGLKADPRFAYMHTIAMSDGDTYGQNLNGDIFGWDELLADQTPDEAKKNPGDMAGIVVPRYKTFEQAKFFKHHANSPYDDSYGDVPLAVINIPMKRIELIIRIARQDVPEMNMKGAPDISERLDGGGMVPVSMGCRIGHEQCSYCGAENEFISQRCPHMANQMGELMPNGVKVAALNFKPRFFDISKVSIPADPIAMSLAKVAAFAPKAKKPNDAKDVGCKAANWRRKWADIVKIIPADAIEKTCREPGEQTLVAPCELSDDELKSAAAAGSFDDVVSTATAMGIVFNPLELAKLASYSGYENVDDVSFSGIDVMSVNYGVVSALKNKMAERSGYFIQPHTEGWHPMKVAESGHDDVSDFYAFYRTAIGYVPFSDLSKAASAIPAIVSLLPRNADTMEAAAYLTRAGL